MSVRVFLSRNIADDSAFRIVAASENIDLIAESLLIFSSISFKEIPEGDWLFFYSKSGVRFFLNQLESQEDISSYQIACYGPSTAKVWALMTGYLPHFTGDGKPAHVPEDFQKKIKDSDKVIFVRAANSRMTVQRAIEDEVDCIDIIAYRNDQRQDVDLKGHFDCAMLTSPLNADAFLQQAPEYDGDIITLGTTTSDFILQKYERDCIISHDVTEAGMLQTFQYWLKTRSK